ncbi:hypothetical protein Tco_1194589 [Tanacetum coccineum]
MSYLSASITAKITKQVKIQLPQILLKEVSKFDPLMIKSMVTESLEHAVLAKESSQPKSTYEKRKTSKDVEPTKGPKIKESTSSSSKGTKSQLKSSRKSVQSEEPEFKVADSDIPQMLIGMLARLLNKDQLKAG